MTTRSQNQPHPEQGTGLPAGDLETLFRRAGVLTEGMEAAKSRRSKATKIGNFLSQHLGREVPVEAQGRTGRATLRATAGPRKQKLYHFDISWDDGDRTESPVTPGSTLAPAEDADEACPRSTEVENPPIAGGAVGNNENW